MALLTCCVLALPLVGQGEGRIDLSGTGQLDRSLWRHDTDAYKVEAGWLSLSAARSSGRKLVSLTSTLGERVRWHGVVRMSALPSLRNHAYILLGCYGQDDAAGEYQYLALSIGGGIRESIALVEVTLKTRDKTPWQTGRERVLIETHQKPDALMRGGVRFAVGYDRARSELTLSLEDYVQPKIRLVEADTRWGETFEQANSFGILCIYTAFRHNGFHFGELSITTSNEAPDQPDRGGDDPTTSEPTPQSLPPLLSEVMVNPLPACPEYIELYNPNETPLSLDGYSLVLSTGAATPPRLLLDGLSIGAKGFIVLTPSPEDLLATYPSAPKAALSRYKLPALPNEGFRLSLYKEGKAVDMLSYNRSDLPKGLKSKKGVAWERARLSVDAPWRAASALDGYATPGLRPKDTDTAEEGAEATEEEGESLAKMLERVAEDKQLRPRLLATDLAGRTLIRLEGRRAIDAVQGLLGRDRRLPMPEKLSRQSGVLTFFLEHSKTKRVDDRWTMKFVCQ